MRVLGFGASNSRRSINARLARYALQRLRSHHVPDAEIDMLDLNDFEMPIYSIDREHSSGVPSLAQRFLDRLAWADRVIISFAEHNGAYTVAFKNVFDWASRIETKLYQGKPLLMYNGFRTKPRLTDDLPPGGDLRVDPRVFFPGCELACPPVCMERTRECTTPELTPGDVYRVFVGDELALTFTAGEGGRVCSTDDGAP